MDGKDRSPINLLLTLLRERSEPRSESGDLGRLHGRASSTSAPQVRFRFSRGRGGGGISSLPSRCRRTAAYHIWQWLSAECGHRQACDEGYDVGELTWSTHLNFSPVGGGAASAAYSVC